MSIRDDVSVNFYLSPRIITVASPSTSISIQDLNDTLRFIEKTTWNGIQFATLLSTSGKNDLGNGVLVGITLSLQNAQLAFEARPGPSYVQCNVSGGNLVAVDNANASIFPIFPTSFTQVVISQSSSATISGIDAVSGDISTIKNKTSEIHQLHGLDSNNPLSVSSTNRSTGSIIQDIAQAGNTVTVTRQ